MEEGRGRGRREEGRGRRGEGGEGGHTEGEFLSKK
jgi:hypothetical protein